MRVFFVFQDPNSISAHSEGAVSIYVQRLLLTVMLCTELTQSLTVYARTESQSAGVNCRQNATT